MLANYFKIAWRNLMKNKIFSFINVFGLSIGLTCCMLITLYLNHEWSYDKHHPGIDNLYQLGTTFVKEGREERSVNTPATMAAAMKQEFPEIQETARLFALYAEDKTLFQYNATNSAPRSFYEKSGYMADPAFFKLFSYDFIEGNAVTALADPAKVVITEEIAVKLFGKEPALNKIIHISSNTNGDHDYAVSGVFRPKTKPSHIQANFFLSFKGGDVEQFMRNQIEMASNNMFQTYLLLKPGTNPSGLENKFPAFVDKYIGKSLKEMGFYKKQFLLAVKDIHLHAGVSVDVTSTGSSTYLYILASIALFTLLIACINFMNLATARSSRRAAEVGVRKVLGAEKRILIWQFLGESILLSLLAFVLACVLAILLLPGFANISGKDISFSFSEQKWLLAGFLGLAFATGFIAGIYPALYMSSFRPLSVLKGKLNNSLAVISMRKGLVVFQFVISVALIISAIVIMNQMRFLRSTDLGFAKDQQVIIPLRSSNAKNIYASLRNELTQNREILSAGASLNYPGIYNPNDLVLFPEGKTVNDAKTVHTNWIDERFLQTLDIKTVSGRLFSADFPADTANGIIINEKAAKEMGYNPAEAPGKTLIFQWRGEANRILIVGVVKDFHFEDLHTPIEPYGFFLNNRPNYNYLVAHTRTGNMKGMLASIGKVWTRLNPGEPFEYSFLDQDFQKNYESEIRLSSLVSYFTIISIFVCCLGLFGLATFSAEQRIKEIGVRKVLGASVFNIVGLISKDFLKLVLIAIVIASPLAWWVMNKWLEDFAYRTSISWTVFVFASLIAVFIALFTISFQAIRAAIANPVKSLRTE